jgi:DNA-binding transcriptional LysR family regulator
MLDVKKLLVLRAVVAQGSIAAAGRHLGYTRSAISQQVSALERAAGTALLVRSGNSVALTPTGRRLLEHTERILVELRSAEATLRKGQSEITGTLRVGVPFREGPAVISSALTSVRRRYPKLMIILAATTDLRGPEEVRRGDLDMVMLSRFGVFPGWCGPGLREWVLGRDPLRLCVPDGHRLAEAESCSLGDLAEESWVLSPATPLGQLTLGLCKAAGFDPSVVATVDDVATALGLVSVGWGVTIAPDLTPVGPGQRVVRLAVAEVGAYRHSVLVIRDGEEESPEIATVVSAVHKSSAKFGYLPAVHRPTVN